MRLVMVSFLVLAGALAGCSSDDGAGSVGPVDCKTTAGVTKKVFAPRCGSSGCHGADSLPDFVSAGVESRVVGVTSGDCAGQTLVVPGQPDGSYLLRKVTDSKPACGVRMPVGGTLAADELACVREWIAALPALPVEVGDAGTDATASDTGAPDTAPTCAAGLTACGASCVDPKSDVANCGGCGKSCSGGQVCNAGSCSSSCATGTTNCGGSCVDTQTAAAHCGACGKACAAGQVCSAGTCSCGTPATLSKDVQPIFTSSCVGTGCHSGAAPRAGLTLTSGRSFGELVNVPSNACSGKILVTPGDVAKSYLMNKLLGVGMCFGTRMPKAEAALSAAELDKVRAWICDGAKND